MMLGVRKVVQKQDRTCLPQRTKPRRRRSLASAMSMGSSAHTEGEVVAKIREGERAIELVWVSTAEIAALTSLSRLPCWSVSETIESCKLFVVELFRKSVDCLISCFQFVQKRLAYIVLTRAVNDDWRSVALLRYCR